MTVNTTALDEYRNKTATNRLGLWLFIISDTLVFGGLYISRFYLLGTGVRPEVNQMVGLGVTIILLASSFFMNRAETSMTFGDRKGFLRGTLITILLGLIFLIGVVGIEWRLAPFGPAAGVGPSLFFTMTGFHAFLVLSGVLFLSIVYRNGPLARRSGCGVLALCRCSMDFLLPSPIPHWYSKIS
jgi:cytochrome c oxidase subunit 3